MSGLFQILKDRRIPLIGLGTDLIIDRDQLENTVKTGIEAGYRLIDTAFGSMNQNLIGDCLTKLFKDGVVKREDLFIVDKLPNNGMRPENVEHFFEKSRKALQLEYIDLYLIQSPIPTKRTDKDENIFPLKKDKDGKVVVDGDNREVVDTDTVDLSKTWAAMEKLVEDKRVKYLGLCNFNKEQIQRIYDGAKIKPVVLELECHVYRPQHDLQKFCSSLNISLSANCPFADPQFTEQAKKDMKYEEPRNAPKLLEDELVQEIALKHKKSPVQVVLGYLAQRDIIPIPKGLNSDRIKEHFEIFDFQLSDEEKTLLKNLEDEDFRCITLDYWGGIADHEEYPFKKEKSSVA